MNLRTWIWGGDRETYEALPPDLFVEGVGCSSYHPHGYCCTRSDRHTGRHAAGDGERILAVWMDRDDPMEVL